MLSYDMAVKAENLVVAYGSVVAVNGLTFQVRRGEVYGLLGPNGAGKTSTIKVLAGVLEPKSGYVEVFGHPISDEVIVKSLIGYVPENIVLLDSLTPREFFEFIASVRKLDSKTANLRLSQLVSAFDFKEYFDTPIAALSMGAKQKVAVIAAFLHNPPLLVLDEPLNGLDARSSRILKELIMIHTRRGGAAIFSTHIMEVAERLCTRVGIINRGRLVGEGTVDELKMLVKSVGGSLEDVFLKVTEQEDSVREIIRALEEG